LLSIMCSIIHSKEAKFLKDHEIFKNDLLPN